MKKNGNCKGELVQTDNIKKKQNFNGTQIEQIRRIKQILDPNIVVLIKETLWRNLMLHEDITERIIKAYYKIYNALGYGFLEKVYENAMMIELRRMGLNTAQQQNIKVYYKSEEVGDYFADIFVENVVIVELKASKTISEDHEAQLINYLKATQIEVGLLLNFGKKPEFKRKIFENRLKNSGLQL